MLSGINNLKLVCFFKLALQYDYSIDYIRPMDMKLVSATGPMLVSRPH